MAQNFVKRFKTWFAQDVINEYKAAAALVIAGYADALAAAGTDAKKRKAVTAANVTAKQLELSNALTEQVAAQKFAEAVALLAPPTSK